MRILLLFEMSRYKAQAGLMSWTLSFQAWATTCRGSEEGQTNRLRNFQKRSDVPPNRSSFLLNETGGSGASSLGFHNKWEADGRSKPRIAHSRPFPQITWVFPTGNTNQKHPLRQLGYSGEDHAVRWSIWLIPVPGLREEPRMSGNRAEHLSFTAVSPTTLKVCRWRHPMVGLR